MACNTVALAMCTKLNSFFSCTRAAPGEERDEFEASRRQQRHRSSKSRTRHTRNTSSVSNDSVGDIISNWDSRITYRAMERADRILDDSEKEREKAREREPEQEQQEEQKQEREQKRERVRGRKRERNGDQRYK